MAAATKFLALATIPVTTHLGGSVRIAEGTVLTLSKKGKLVIPSFSVRVGMKGEKTIPAITTNAKFIDLCRWLKPMP